VTLIFTQLYDLNVHFSFSLGYSLGCCGQWSPSSD